MFRLYSSAHQAGRHVAVVVSLARLVDIEAFDGVTPEHWFVRASELKLEGFCWLRQLPKAWVCRFGGSNDGARYLIRERQDDLFLSKNLLSKNRFRMADHVRLLLAEPPDARWITLGRRSEVERSPLAVSFGVRQPDALEALRAALERRHEAAVHVMLERWLSEVTS